MTIATHWDPQAGLCSDVFVDRIGIAHTLVPGHRDRLKPTWRRQLVDNPPAPSASELEGEFRALTERLNLTERVLRLHDSGFANNRMLTVGCGDPVELLFLAARGAAHVTGVDRRVDSDRHHHAPLRDAALDYLAKSNAPTPDEKRIAIVQDDIGASHLPDGSFDVICSWRTLEHLREPAAALAEMYRLLRPGGIAYHEYNPFFGLDGGHALVTLDCPWGHVRFNRDDLARYLLQHRPAEYDCALAYYDDCLNRMSQSDLGEHARAAGFETLAFIPRTRTEDLLAVDAPLLAAARRNYPQLTLNDLICRVVRVVQRRPLD